MAEAAARADGTLAAETAARPAWWLEWLAAPVLALQFLLAVPVPLAVPATPRHLGRSMACFPLAGAALGLALAAFDWLLRQAFPLPVASALVLSAAVLLTGGLHLDGLIDTCDGLFGGRTPERRLEIMRDSRVGSFGVAGGVLALLIKYAALAALPPALRPPVLVLQPVAGRWVMAAAIWLFPYARPAGLGAAFKEGARWPAVALATVAAAALAWLAFGPPGLAVLVPAAAASALAGRFMMARLGGLTGDCYGAMGELAEIVVLLVLVQWLVPR